MSQNRDSVPKKLKHDAIVEVVFEIRFDMTGSPEIFFGRLADFGPWRGFQQDALPASNIPPLMRQTDPNLRYQPVIQLSEPGGLRSIRIGQQVLSYHRMAPYVGWEVFRTELNQVFDALFQKAEGLSSVSRLGIRYINSLRKDLHGIDAITDLDLKVEIAKEQVQKSISVIYLSEHPGNTQSIVRIATADLVAGLPPSGTALLVDVDVYTKPGFKTTDIEDVKRWAEFAHTEEKKQFFRLLKDETIQELVVN